MFFYLRAVGSLRGAVALDPLSPVRCGLHSLMFCVGGDFYLFQAFLGPGVGTVAASAWLSALQIGIFKSVQLGDL